MSAYDVFNGDADGICALHQLRLHEPREATLVTGVKRDIRLLERLANVHDATVTVLDISYHENREQVAGLLERDCSILYFDHHYAGEVARHPALETYIETAPEVCTSLLVDDHLGGRYRAWAVTAAFGDNLVDQARIAARPLRLTEQELEALHTLGEVLNYNGYGDTLEDLHFDPAELYRAVHGYADPLEFFGNAPEAEALQRGFLADMARAKRLSPLLDVPAGRVFRFPDLVWARRVMGVYANRLANETPESATALIVDNPDGTLRISVRAPLERPTGADALCRAFPTGGGRTGAAGITACPPGELPRFLTEFEQAFSQ
jgi:single-stranded DNA-specific DHH superfamily exonuclease